MSRFFIRYRKVTTVVGVLTLFILLNYILNITYYNPIVAVRALGWLENHKIGNLVRQAVEAANFNNGKEEQYPLVSIARLEDNLFTEPRAAVIGTVDYVQKSYDGDTHVNIRADNGRVLAAEIVPELPIFPPPIGVRVKIWGVTRYDLQHRWWELHPVIGWEKL